MSFSKPGADTVRVEVGSLHAKKAEWVWASRPMNTDLVQFAGCRKAPYVPSDSC